MPQANKNKGNRNAALKPGERGRIQWTQSLSGEHLILVLTHLEAQNLNDSEARRVLREKSEELFEEWIKTLC